MLAFGAVDDEKNIELELDKIYDDLRDLAIEEMDLEWSDQDLPFWFYFKKKACAFWDLDYAFKHETSKDLRNWH